MLKANGLEELGAWELNTLALHKGWISFVKSRNISMLLGKCKAFCLLIPWRFYVAIKK